jgi:protein ImuA
MTTQLLTRRQHRPSRTGQPLVGDLELKKGRLHECCGSARHLFALMMIAQTEGEVFWISPSWMPSGLNPDGMVGLVDPGRFIFVSPQRPEDILWTLEEILRSGAVPLAVADIPGMPGLTSVRRLHLAAETGGTEGQCLPTGLLLTPGEGGAQGVESRWQLRPDHKSAEEAWQLKRLRARTAPVTEWRMSREMGKFRLAG